MIPVYTLLKEINVACFHPEPIHLNYLKDMGIYSTQCFRVLFSKHFFLLISLFFRVVVKPCSVLPLRTEKERKTKDTPGLLCNLFHVPVYFIPLAINVFTATHTICKYYVFASAP